VPVSPKVQESQKEAACCLFFIFMVDWLIFVLFDNVRTGFEAVVNI
jgi:hypothetical protein